MQLIKAIKELRGSPAIVPDCPRSTLPEFCIQMGYKKGAEIGVYKAAYSELFCKAGIFMYCIDPWLAFKGQGRTQQVQARQDFLFGHANRTLEPYSNKKIIRKKSTEAVKYFQDGELDFVYIDGDHSLVAVSQDIFAWNRIVRKGGMVAGHDFFNTPSTSRNTVCQVETAVTLYTNINNIGNWYIFGEDKESSNKDDRFYSWMWIKDE